jgi:cytochrome c biogenesis protein CcdA
MYKYLSIYLGRYLDNKFLAPLLGIVLNCVFKVFPFILVISVYGNLKKKKKKIKKKIFFILFYIFIFIFFVPFGFILL